MVVGACSHSKRRYFLPAPLPTSPNSGPGMAQTQVHSAQASAGPRGETRPTQSQPPGPPATHHLFWGGPAKACKPLPFPSQGGWPGLGSHCPGCETCGSFKEQGWESCRERHCHTIPSSLPSPVGYLEQLPLNPALIWFAEAGLSVLVLQPHPLWGEGCSGLPPIS